MLPIENDKFITEEKACQLLNISSDQIKEWVKSGNLLSFVSDNGRFYPSFQFENGAVLPVVKSFIKDSGVDTQNIKEMNNIVLIMFFEINFDYGKEYIHNLLFDKEAYAIILNKYLAIIGNK